MKALNRVVSVFMLIIVVSCLIRGSYVAALTNLAFGSAWLYVQSKKAHEPKAEEEADETKST